MVEHLPIPSRLKQINLQKLPLIRGNELIRYKDLDLLDKIYDRPTFSNLAHHMTMEVFERLLERSMRTAAILGVPWVVLHSTNVTREEGETFREALDYNIQFYRKLIPVLEQTGVGIALSE